MIRVYGFTSPYPDMAALRFYPSSAIVVPRNISSGILTRSSMDNCSRSESKQASSSGSFTCKVNKVTVLAKSYDMHYVIPLIFGCLRHHFFSRFMKTKPWASCVTLMRRVNWCVRAWTKAQDSPGKIWKF